MPLSGHRVIPARWSEHHRPVASGGHTATCTITRDGGEGTLDGDNVWHPPDTVTVYTGPCTIAPASNTSAGVKVVGEGPVAIGYYEVAITWDAGEIAEDDVVVVTGAADPLLDGQQLRVVAVRYGSEQWERVLTCVQDLTNREAR